MDRGRVARDPAHEDDSQREPSSQEIKATLRILDFYSKPGRANRAPQQLVELARAIGEVDPDTPTTAGTPRAPAIDLWPTILAVQRDDAHAQVWRTVCELVWLPMLPERALRSQDGARRDLVRLAVTLGMGGDDAFWVAMSKLSRKEIEDAARCSEDVLNEARQLSRAQGPPPRGTRLPDRLRRPWLPPAANAAGAEDVEATGDDLDCEKARPWITIAVRTLADSPALLDEALESPSPIRRFVALLAILSLPTNFDALFSAVNALDPVQVAVISRSIKPILRIVEQRREAIERIAGDRTVRAADVNATSPAELKDRCPRKRERDIPKPDRHEGPRASRQARAHNDGGGGGGGRRRRRGCRRGRGCRGRGEGRCRGGAGLEVPDLPGARHAKEPSRQAHRAQTAGLLEQVLGRTPLHALPHGCPLHRASAAHPRLGDGRDRASTCPSLNVLHLVAPPRPTWTHSE